MSDEWRRVSVDGTCSVCGAIHGDDELCVSLHEDNTDRTGSFWNKIGQNILDEFDGKVPEHPFYHYEPWDVKARPQWVKDQAIKDDVDIEAEEIVRACGRDPHTFQTGYFMSTKPIRSLIAASRVGKSSNPLVEMQIMASGVIPVSMRYDEGVDTGIKRLITGENILRWGRRDIKTLEIIDFNPSARRDGKWDCGNIIGVGKYPIEKIAPEGSTLWIGTTQKALQEHWWPKLSARKGGWMVPEFLDPSFGQGGYNKQERVIGMIRDIRLATITYEAGYDRFESIMTHACCFDEEAVDRRCMSSAIVHTHFFSFVMSPLHGLTYTRKLLFPKKKNPNIDVFHAVAYDSPYLSREKIEINRSMISPWEIGSKIWGLFTESSGEPYFDRQKIESWIQRFPMPYDCAKIVPSQIDTLWQGQAHLREVEEENDQDVWRIYEKVKENTAYWLMADSAEGAQTPEDSADVLASLVMRPPRETETKPQIVASLRSTLPVEIFAQVCAYALAYYNLPLLCAEGPTRGSYNAMFFMTLKDYPYWFKQVSQRDSNRKVRNVIGFDTNSATRIAIFTEIRAWLNDFDSKTYPEIRDEPLLHELSACVTIYKGGKGRPDHTSTGTLDTALCFGQGWHVYQHYRDQIQVRKKRARMLSFMEQLAEKMVDKSRQPVYLGEGIED